MVEKKKLLMVYKNTKRGPTIIKELWIKIRWYFHVKIAKLIKTNDTQCCWDCGKTGSSTSDGNIDWYSQLRDILILFINVKNWKCTCCVLQQFYLGIEHLHMYTGRLLQHKKVTATLLVVYKTVKNLNVHQWLSKLFSSHIIK